MRIVLVGLLCCALGACDLIGAKNFESQDLGCSFKVPKGFAVQQEESGQVALARDDKMILIAVLRHMADQPIAEENINALGASFIAPSLGIQDIYEIDKVVKLYGNREVSGRKAAWFYYPEESKGTLTYQVFLVGEDNSMYQIVFWITPREGEEYVDEVEKLVTAFLEGFKVTEGM